MSQWKDSFRAYEHLQARWPPEGHPIVRDLVYSSKPEYWLEQYTPVRPQQSFLSEVEGIRPIIREAMERVSKEPFDDVYHTAIYMECYREHWEHSGNSPSRATQSLLARTSLPCIGAPTDKQDLTSKDYNSRLNKLAAFSEALSEEYRNEFKPYQRIAIGQHYGLHTWLLDLTGSDPWVGLFFASFGWRGREQIGVTRLDFLQLNGTGSAPAEITLLDQ